MVAGSVDIREFQSHQYFDSEPPVGNPEPILNFPFSTRSHWHALYPELVRWLTLMIIALFSEVAHVWVETGGFNMREAYSSSGL